MSVSQSDDTRRVFRFAPSPTGYLHCGHALSAILNQRAAKVTDGRLLLRIEDVDITRARKEFEAAIFEDLAWLGLEWEEPVLKQRDRFDAYAKALAELDKLGLLYPAFMSRNEIAEAVDKAGPKWPRDPDGAPHYPGPEREWSASRRRAEMASGKPYALRLDMVRALSGLGPLLWSAVDPFGIEPPTAHPADPAAWGDVILARKEVHGSYHIAVVVDDAYQGVTNIVRGKDLEASTSVHRLLQTLLGLPDPRYFHHRLILDAGGKKLSKSRGSETIRARREAGETPEELIAGLGL
jgi:glutamyl-Q tRNA(Asp) synthetase